MLGFGSLGFGQLPNPDQRTRLDPGAIEPGKAGFGSVMFGGPDFPPIPAPAPTPAPVTAQRFVPGHRHEAPHYPRGRSPEEIRRDRDALWDVPERVEAVIEQAATKVIAKVSEQDASPERPNPLEWLAANYRAQSRALAADLKRLKIKASEQERAHYMLLLGLEIEERIAQKRLQDEEEEQVIMLMMAL